MMKGITLPDGRVISMEEAQSGAIANPPAPLPYLRDLASERRDDGPPHVTDLLIGTREAYLRKTEDYLIDFDDGAFSLLGRAVHSVLEHDRSVTEIGWDIGWIQGKADLLELHGGNLVLIDYKAQGAYSVRKYIGMDYHEVPVTDSAGNEILLKTGKNAGKPKTRKVWFRNPEKADTRNIAYQMNMYRVALNKALEDPKIVTDPLTAEMLKPFTGKKIDRMKVFFIVRDASTMQATNQGITQRTYFEDVPYLSDVSIEDYFHSRSIKLSRALVEEEPPELCSDFENWEGRKCKEYCPVAKYCQALGDNPYLTSENHDSTNDIAF